MNYEYLNSGADWSETADLLQADLAKIDIDQKDAQRRFTEDTAHTVGDARREMMKQRGTYLVPDMYDDTVIMQQPPGYPNSFIQKERAAGQSQIEVVKRAGREAQAFVVALRCQSGRRRKWVQQLLASFGGMD